MAGGVLFEMRLNGKDLEILDGGRLRAFMYFHTVRGSAQYSVILEDLDWTYFDGLYEEDAEVILRFGRDLATGKVWSPEHKMTVGAPVLSLHPEAVFVQIAGLDKGANIYNRCSQKIWTATTVSDIVRELAEENGLDSRVEDTEGEIDTAQGQVPDGHFIQNVLLPLAYNTTRKDYLCYIEHGDTLVFEPPDLSASQLTVNYPSKGEDYDADAPPKLHYRPLLLRPNGSWSTQVRVVSPLKKEAYFFTADDNTVTYKKLASTGPTAPDTPARIVISSKAENQTELDAIAQALWSTKMRELWIVDVRAPLAPEVEVGKPIELNVLSGDGKSHFSSGKYLLAGVLHWIDVPNGEAYTRYWLDRRTR